MAADKLVPYDPRVERASASINGKYYQYMRGTPKGTPKGTVLLLHGFPGLAFNFNAQIPLLMDMGFQVIAPDMLGYGFYQAPDDLALFSLKSVGNDMLALVAPLMAPNEKIILGAHDWGAMVAWRMALWHPDAIKAIFAMCAAYTPPSSDWLDDYAFINQLPNFKYWMQFGGPEVENKIVGKDMLRKFLNTMYLGRGPNGEVGFTVNKGVIFENLDKIGKSPIISDSEMDFYVDNYAYHGLHDPLNWYRTRRINWDEDLELATGDREKFKINVPVLMITASKDNGTPPSMAANMSQFIDTLTLKNVDASHWVMMEAADEVNGYIKPFLDDVTSKNTQARL